MGVNTHDNYFLSIARALKGKKTILVIFYKIPMKYKRCIVELIRLDI